MVDPEELLSTARALFGEAAARLPSLRARCEGQVSEWMWATDECLSPIPIRDERHGETPGRPMKRPPKSPRGKVQYGLDAQGRPWVERNFLVDIPSAFYLTLCEWDVSPVRCWHYLHTEFRPINVTLFAFRDSRLEVWVRSAIRGESIETIAYDAEGRAVRTEMLSREPGREPARLVYEAEYEGTKVVRVRGQSDDGSWSQVYPPKRGADRGC